MPGPRAPARAWRSADRASPSLRRDPVGAVMVRIATEGDSSGNPALGSKAASALLAETAPRSMTVGGTSVKTLFLLLVLIAGGAWGWASASTPVETDLGGGFGNTTVTIPGGF